MRDAGELSEYRQLMSVSQTSKVQRSSPEDVEVMLFPPSPEDNRPWIRQIFTTRAPATFDKVALVAAALGGLIGSGLWLTFSVPSLGAYMVATGIFHLLEFWVTARFNPSKIGMASFLLTNGIEYVVAQVVSAAEYLIRWYYTRRLPAFPSRSFVAGIAMLLCGQIVRTGAMIQAAASFSHFLQSQRKEDHVLVQHGLYSIVRHPSYAGFYAWAVGSQILLNNFVSSVLFAAVLLHFFTLRIREEERSLVKFFGNDYVAYRERVWSGIPFVP